MGTLMLYLPFAGPVVGGWGLNASHELKGAAMLPEEINVNRPALASQEMIRLLPESVALMVGLAGVGLALEPGFAITE